LHKKIPQRKLWGIFYEKFMNYCLMNLDVDTPFAVVTFKK
jgi:hypothetical protein